MSTLFPVRRARCVEVALFGLAALLLFIGASLWAQTKSGRAPGFSSLAQKADAARDAERLDEAAGLYRKALALQPSWKEGWWSLGTILYDQNSCSAATNSFRKLLTYDPQNGTAHLMLALCEYQLNLDDAAIK